LVFFSPSSSLCSLKESNKGGVSLDTCHLLHRTAGKFLKSGVGPWASRAPPGLLCQAPKRT
jgi:hypothetical protein